MGVVVGGVFGDVKNGVGNVVFSSWKGRNTIRKKALSVANPRTTPQVNQRTKFKSSSAFFSAILGLWVKPLWDRFSGNVTGYNAIMSVNTDKFSNSGVPDYSQLVMSRGKMLPVEDLDAVADVSASTVTVTGIAPSDSAWGSPNETVFVAVFRMDGDELIGVGTEVVNAGQSFEILFGDVALTLGENLSIFASIKRADGTQVSNSKQAFITAVA